MLIIYDFGMNFEMYIFIFFAYADATNSSYNTFFFFFGLESKMSSTSVSDRALSGLRYVNKTCRCGHRAGVRISKFDMNMNKLYYCYPHDKYRFLPITEFEATSSTVNVSQVLREVHQLWVDIVSLQKTIESFKRSITLGIGLVVCFALMYWA